MNWSLILGSNWGMDDLWIVVIGALAAMACALLGNFLLLRKMSMMGDAISHAVLPGLAIAFIVTGGRDSLAMFGGAAIAGLLTALLVHAVSRRGGIDEGSAMGVVFTSLFALGLILIKQAADHVDLDPGCVLYGAIELAPWDTVDFANGWEIPRAAIVNGCALLANLAFVLLFFKELKVSSFDPDLATTLGINANAMHYALMALVAATTVAAFESVGSILVIAMLIVPAAAAHLLTDRLWTMILASLILGALSAILGHWSAVVVPGWFGFDDATSTAGMMGVAAGFLFLLAFLFAPRHGVASRLLHQWLLGLQVARGDALGYLYRRAERAAEANAFASNPSLEAELAARRDASLADSCPALESPLPLAPAPARDIRAAMGRRGRFFGVTARLALWNLLRRKSVTRCPDVRDALELTPLGESEARGLVRSHRLWEGYLATEAGVRPDHVHGTADRLEHVTGPAMRRELEEATGSPAFDPHARVIPREDPPSNAGAPAPRDAG